MGSPVPGQVVPEGYKISLPQDTSVPDGYTITLPTDPPVPQSVGFKGGTRPASPEEVALMLKERQSPGWRSALSLGSAAVAGGAALPPIAAAMGAPGLATMAMSPAGVGLASAGYKLYKTGDPVEAAKEGLIMTFLTKMGIGKGKIPKALEAMFPKAEAAAIEAAPAAEAGLGARASVTPVTAAAPAGEVGGTFSATVPGAAKATAQAAVPVAAEEAAMNAARIKHGNDVEALVTKLSPKYTKDEIAKALTDTFGHPIEKTKEAVDFLFKELKLKEFVPKSEPSSLVDLLKMSLDGK